MRTAHVIVVEFLFCFFFLPASPYIPLSNYFARQIFLKTLGYDVEKNEMLDLNEEAAVQEASFVGFEDPLDRGLAPLLICESSYIAESTELDNLTFV